MTHYEEQQARYVTLHPRDELRGWFRYASERFCDTVDQKHMDGADSKDDSPPSGLWVNVKQQLQNTACVLHTKLDWLSEARTCPMNLATSPLCKNMLTAAGWHVAMRLEMPMICDSCVY